jgi:hypothetical protein
MERLRHTSATAVVVAIAFLVGPVRKDNPYEVDVSNPPADPLAGLPGEDADSRGGDCAHRHADRHAPVRLNGLAGLRRIPRR